MTDDYQIKSIVGIMFCQPCDENSQNTITTHVLKNLPSKNNSVKRKQKNKQIKKALKRNHSKLTIAMSTWAENFTVAATWQLQHRIAYWKARAKSLEYENAILHEVIRKNQYKFDLSSSTPTKPTKPIKPTKPNKSAAVETRTEEYSESDDEGEFVVSEQYIQFVADNAKYKEDARNERERLKAKQEEEDAKNMEQPRETIEENRERLMELYGDKWKKISALETNMFSKFITKSDIHKPAYWPNIPFNFN